METIVWTWLVIALIGLNPLVALALEADPPSSAEIQLLFDGVNDTTFKIPKEPLVPPLGDSCWKETAAWKRIGMRFLDNGKIGEDQGPGVRKLVTAYHREKDSPRCSTSGGSSAVFEQAFHPTGPNSGLWWIHEGTQEKGFSFFSKYLFLDNSELSFYREDCREFQRDPKGKRFLVCRVINQNSKMEPGFVAYLTYEPI